MKPMHALFRSHHRAALPRMMVDLDASPRITGFLVVVRAGEPLPTVPTGVRKPVRMVPLEEPYGWSRALNAGLSALPPPQDEPLVMIVSNEVSIRAADVERLALAALGPESSCGYAGFARRTEPSYRLPRNTCIVWNRAVFELGFFDEQLDRDAGMEDYELALRAYTARKWLPRHAGIEVGLQLRLEVDFVAKLAREERAMRHIEAKYSAADVTAFKEYLSEHREA